LRSLSRSKTGVAAILLGIWAVYGVIHDFLDLLRDVAYTAKHAGPAVGALIALLNFLIGALNFFTTPTGNLVAIIIAAILILWALRTQPDEVDSGNAAAAQTRTAQDAAQLKTELDEAKQEIERLRIELNNRPPRRFNTPVEVVETPTLATAKEIEQLKVENKRLRDQLASPELAKQKRLCSHYADDLNGLYESFQYDERVLLAQLRKRKAAGATKEELEDERGTKQAELEKRVRRKYHAGFSDRLEKLYEELAPDGWLGPNDEGLFLGVSNPLDIMKVADRLEEIGQKL